MNEQSPPPRPSFSEQMAALQRVGVELGRAFSRMAENVQRAALTLGAALQPWEWVLRVDDPGARRAENPRDLLQQMRDIMLHEFWAAAGEPERSPGARWVRVPRRRSSTS